MKNDDRYPGHRELRRRNHIWQAGPTAAGLAAGRVAVGLLAAACGGSPGSAGRGVANAGPASSADGSVQAYSQCMRSRGVPDVPDLRPQGGIQVSGDAGSDAGFQISQPGVPALHLRPGRLRPGRRRAVAEHGRWVVSAALGPVTAVPAADG
jgi:hypothetical protein